MGKPPVSLLAGLRMSQGRSGLPLSSKAIGRLLRIPSALVSTVVKASWERLRTESTKAVRIFLISLMVHSQLPPQCGAPAGLNLKSMEKRLAMPVSMLLAWAAMDLSCSLAILMKEVP